MGGRLKSSSSVSFSRIAGEVRACLSGWSLLHLLPLILLTVWLQAIMELWTQAYPTLWYGSFYSLRGIVCILAAVLVFVLARRLKSGCLPKKTPTWFKLLLSLLPLAAFSLGMTSLTGALVGAAGFIGLAWGYVRCGSLYSRMSSVQAVVYVLIGGIFVHAVPVVATYMSEALLLVLASVVPFLLDWLCSREVKPLADKTQQEPCAASTFTNGYLVALTIELFLFSMVPGFMDTARPPLSWALPLLGLLINTLLLFILLRYRATLRISQFFDFVLLGSLVVFVVLSFGVNLSTLTLDVAVIPNELTYALTWVLLIAIERSGVLPHSTAILAGWGVHFLGIGIGYFLSQFAHLDGAFTQGVVFLFFVLVAAVIVVSDKFVDDSLFGGRRSDNQLEDASTEFDRRCASIGQRFDLTNREVEVVSLIARGRSKAYIAQELFISENTVKNHARNAYNKMDIHSKQELLDLLEQGE